MGAQTIGRDKALDEIVEQASHGKGREVVLLLDGKQLGRIVVDHIRKQFQGRF